MVKAAFTAANDSVEKPQPRVNLILIDELIENEIDRQPEYNSWDDPEDLTTYLEPYQNDYE